ncbi:hypothetical protein [Neolewinella antarctica]|uniref:Uncharacterized protein n=1 Tax=Neolewinella antarctica TaxID=442734 RepID=A0ABX0X6R8_9BACT|nr:hypothetical protein [Neolewinella antarctica]NJC24912.1 hypothetical protein [Neolewinella antarctica]
MSIKHKEVAASAARWQRCQTDDLPRAFYAFDASGTKAQTERVASYRFGRGEANRLLRAAKGTSGFQFVVHLGLDKTDLSGSVATAPAFQLYLQVLSADTGWQQGCEVGTWVKDGKFSAGNSVVTASSLNAMPAAGAYLFVYSWLETSQAELAQPFTATTRVTGERIQAYTFSKVESESIYLDMLAGKKGRKRGVESHVDVHLGNGVAIWAHPFSFRPVLEVSGAITQDGNRSFQRDASGLSDTEGASFYDYSLPTPPGPPRYV